MNRLTRGRAAAAVLAAAAALLTACADPAEMGADVRDLNPSRHEEALGRQERAIAPLWGPGGPLGTPASAAEQELVSTAWHICPPEARERITREARRAGREAYAATYRELAATTEHFALIDAMNRARADAMRETFLGELARWRAADAADAAEAAGVAR